MDKINLLYILKLFYTWIILKIICKDMSKNLFILITYHITILILYICNLISLYINLCYFESNITIYLY
jgi:hypothetical protein